MFIVEYTQLILIQLVCVLFWKNVQQNITRYRDIVFVGEINVALFSKYTESGRLFKYKLEIERERD